MEKSETQRKAFFEDRLECIDELMAEEDTAALLPTFQSSEERYSEYKLLGQGGMKKVFSVQDALTDRRVAMAVLHQLSEARLSEQFLYEARITASLEHPGIMPIYDMGLDSQGSPFFTMKNVQGEELGSVLSNIAKAKKGYSDRYNQAELILAFTKICEAVEYAHSRGVLHLDLKPENILIADFGQVIVCDWGLARYHEVELSEADRESVASSSSGLTLHGKICGTPGYMAPEQIFASRDTLDERADVFALGSILYGILSNGKTPYTGESVQTVMVQTVNGVMKRPSKRFADLDIPFALEAICLKAMATKPETRYQSVSEMHQDILNYTRGFATSAEKAGAWTHFYLFYQRHRFLYLLTVSFLVTLIGSGIFFIQSFKAERDQSNLNAAKAEENAAKRAISEERAKANEAKAKANLAKFKEEQRKTKILTSEAMPEIKKKLDLMMASLEIGEIGAQLKKVREFLPDSDFLYKTQFMFSLIKHDFVEAEKQWESTGLSESFLHCVQGLRSHALKKTFPKEILLKLCPLLQEEEQTNVILSLLRHYELLLEKGKAADYCRDLLHSMNVGWDPTGFQISEEGKVLKVYSSVSFKDISALCLLSDLRSLDIQNTQVKDLAVLQGSSLEFLNIAGTRVSSLLGIKNLGLKELDISHCEIRSLYALPKKLAKLRILNTPVRDFSPLKSISTLEMLVISDSQEMQDTVIKCELSLDVRVLMKNE